MWQILTIGIFSFTEKVCAPVGKRVSPNTHLFGMIKGRKLAQIQQHTWTL